MSDIDKKLQEIRARHERDARWHCGPSMMCPESHDDRGFLLEENERLRARVEELASLLGYFTGRNDDSIQVMLSRVDAALKEAAP